jgi:hypothetical protein
VHRPASSERSIRPGRVERESADQLAILSDDADVGAGDWKADFAVLVGDADRDVTKPAQVTKGELAEAIDLVAADAMVERSWLEGRPCLKAAVEDGEWGLAVEGTVWSVAVVVEAEGVEL